MDGVAVSIVLVVLDWLAIWALLWRGAPKKPAADEEEVSSITPNPKGGE